MDKASNLAERLEPFKEKLGVFDEPNPLDRSIVESDRFLSLDIPQKQTLMAPWLKEQSIGLITGWRGTGKTWFCMSILQAITSGRPFGPWEIENSCPCLYLEAEMAACDVQERVRELMPDDERKAPLYVYSDGYANSLGVARARLLDDEWRENMKDVLFRRDVKLWVADNLSSLCPGIDENSKQDWDPINQWLLGLRFAGVSTLLVHHTNKEGGQRGTSAHEDNIDVSLNLVHPPGYLPEEGCRFIVKFSKARIPTQAMLAIADTEFRLQMGLNDCLIWTHQSVKKQVKMEVLRMLNEGTKQEDIKEILEISKGRVSQIKSEALSEGLLQKKGSQVELTPSGWEYINGS